MACTTILVGGKATNDGSPIIARNEDTGDGTFNSKKMVVVEPDKQPRIYTGVTSHLTMELPDNPLRYVCVPNADQTGGVWAEAGINAANVTMSSTETISSNARVLGADPLVVYQPAVGKEGDANYVPEKPGGIGEENMPTIILPYIRSAKEGVQRMGMLLEKYGTYEMNGVAFGDSKEIWYIETIGGHHWIARRVPDDCYCPLPNKQGIDWIDLRDALGEQKDYMCSKDLPQWMAKNNLNMVFDQDQVNQGDTIDGIPVAFNPRYAFTSWTWLDTIYNNSRPWYVIKNFNPNDPDYNGPTAKYGPEYMQHPWCIKPEAKLSVLDIKNMMSTTYDGTPYDPYGLKGDEQTHKRYRFIGINRTAETSILHVRPKAAKAAAALQWVSFGSQPFNTSVAIFTNVKKIPAYLDTDPEVITTDSLYWTNRIIAGLADPEFFDNFEYIYGYQQACMAQGYAQLAKVDDEIQQKGLFDADMDDARVIEILERSNEELVAFVKQQTNALMQTILYNRSLKMKNAYGASDH